MDNARLVYPGNSPKITIRRFLAYPPSSFEVIVLLFLRAVALLLPSASFFYPRVSLARPSRRRLRYISSSEVPRPHLHRFIVAVPSSVSSFGLSPFLSLVSFLRFFILSVFLPFLPRHPSPIRLSSAARFPIFPDNDVNRTFPFHFDLVVVRHRRISLIKRGARDDDEIISNIAGFRV